MARSLSIFWGALACAGCGWDADVAAVLARPVCDTLDTDAVCKDIFGGSSSSGADWTTSGGGIMTTTVVPGATTDGGSDGESGDGASGGGSSGDGGSSDGAGAPGDVDAGLWATLSLSPAQVSKVMNVEISLAWSGPIVAVDLHLGDTPLLLGVPPAAALHTLKVTSDDVPGNGEHELCARVHAIDGRTIKSCAKLDVGVTAGGEVDWKKEPFGGVVSALTSVAVLGDDLAVAGYVMPKGEVPKLVVAVLDGASGAPKFPPAVLDYETIAWSGEATGPALTVDPDGSIYVAATVVDGMTTTRVFHQFNPETLAEAHSARYGIADEDATAIALCQNRVVVVGSVRTAANPDRYDLRVWWLSEESGFELHPPTTLAPPMEDAANDLSERAYGVTCVGGDVVVVGTREIWPNINAPKHMRTVVLRFASPGAVSDVWTSPGDVLAEDAALGVAPTMDGGFAVTGWTRNKFSKLRQVLTRRFTADGSLVWPPRHELTGDEDAIGRALAEDLEGKLIVAGARKQPSTDWNAWIFAAPDLANPRTWEKIHNGPSNGPDEGFGLALDDWGYPHVVGTEFEAFTMTALALRLYP